MLAGRYFHELLRRRPHDCGRRTLTALVATTRLRHEIFQPTLSKPMFALQQHHELLTRRFFAKGAKRRKEINADLPLANEQLVAQLMKKSGGASAEEMQVRVRGTDATTSVVPLKEAINMSIAASSDLVAVAIDQEVPVVAISDLSVLAYQSKKAAKQNGNIGTKEVAFKVGIAENDFQRKLDSVIKFLDKGHNCSVSVKALRRHMQTNANIAEETAKKILNLLNECAEIQKPLQMNEGKNVGQFQLRPKKYKAT